MKVFKYQCHRQFLSDFIEQNYLTRHEFLDSLKIKITKGALSHFLKKNSREEFTRSYKFKLTTWAELLSQLKINQKEYDYLILLKLSEDMKLEYGQGGKPFKALVRMRNLVSKNRQAEDRIWQAIDTLPERRQKRVFLTIFKELDYFMSARSRLERSSKLGQLRDYFRELAGGTNGSRNR